MLHYNNYESPFYYCIHNNNFIIILHQLRSAKFEKMTRELYHANEMTVRFVHLHDIVYVYLNNLHT